MPWGWLNRVVTAAGVHCLSRVGVGAVMDLSKARATYWNPALPSPLDVVTSRGELIKAMQNLNGGLYVFTDRAVYKLVEKPKWRVRLQQLWIKFLQRVR
jgi:hypothetical protein